MTVVRVGFENGEGWQIYLFDSGAGWHMCLTAVRVGSVSIQQW